MWTKISPSWENLVQSTRVPGEEHVTVKFGTHAENPKMFALHPQFHEWCIYKRELGWARRVQNLGVLGACDSKILVTDLNKGQF